jgi:hypothetical protein
VQPKVLTIIGHETDSPPSHARRLTPRHYFAIKQHMPASDVAQSIDALKHCTGTGPDQAGQRNDFACGNGEGNIANAVGSQVLDLQQTYLGSGAYRLCRVRSFWCRGTGLSCHARDNSVQDGGLISFIRHFEAIDEPTFAKHGYTVCNFGNLRQMMGNEDYRRAVVANGADDLEQTLGIFPVESRCRLIQYQDPGIFIKR